MWRLDSFEEMRSWTLAAALEQVDRLHERGSDNVLTFNDQNCDQNEQVGNINQLHRANEASFKQRGQILTMEGDASVNLWNLSRLKP